MLVSPEEAETTTGANLLEEKELIFVTLTAPMYSCFSFNGEDGETNH